MFTGVGVLGVLAGSLASFFRVRSPDDRGDSSADGEPPADGVSNVKPEVLAQQIAQLREQMDRLMGLLSELSSGEPGGSD